jgi:AcrR family transcriptional regulator
MRQYKTDPDLPASTNPVTPAQEPAPSGDGRKNNAAATQVALRAVGRRLFGQLGYEATSLGAICAEAGVTTGALYHHFGDKKGLFAAVAEELDSSLVALTGKASARALAQGADPWQAFLAAIDVFLQAGMNPEGRRIALTDAPAVLGAQAWLEIRERQGLGAMAQTVRALQSFGLLPRGNVRMQARLILGLLYGAIEALAQQPEDTPTALDDARELVHAMLEGLRGAGKNTATALPQA